MPAKGDAASVSAPPYAGVGVIPTSITPDAEIEGRAKRPAMGRSNDRASRSGGFAGGEGGGSFGCSESAITSAAARDTDSHVGPSNERVLSEPVEVRSARSAVHRSLASLSTPPRAESDDIAGSPLPSISST